MNQVDLKIAMYQKSIKRCQFNHTLTTCDGDDIVVRVFGNPDKIECVCEKALQCLEESYPIVEVLVR